MKKFKLINLIKTFTTCLFLLICVSAQAFQVVLDGTDTNATHILELDIGGTSYDVTFVNSSAATAVVCPSPFGDPGTYPCDLYAANPPSDVGDATGADAAVAQILLALNEDASIGGSGSPAALTVGQGQNQLLVPWRFDVSACNGGVGGTQGTCAANAFRFGEAGSWGAFPFAEVQSTIIVDFARFSPGGTVAIVPIPPAAWLFGSALGMLGWARRRARQAASSNEAMASHMG